MPSTAVIEFPFGKTPQCSVDLSIYLDSFAHKYGSRPDRCGRSFRSSRRCVRSSRCCRGKRWRRHLPVRAGLSPRRRGRPRPCPSCCRIEHGRRPRLPYHGDRPSRPPEFREVDDIQQLRKAGILVTAQRRVQHMVRQDARVVVVIPGTTHRCLAESSRFADSHSGAVLAGPVGHLPIIAFRQPSVPRDRDNCPSR